MAKTEQERKRRDQKRREKKKEQREQRKNRKTCLVSFGPNFVETREGKPSFSRYFPSRKRLLALGLQVGRKAKKR